MVKPHTLFISDLHLDANDAQAAQRFFDFLQHRAIQAEALYILGDFFEVWIGDDDLTPFHRQVIQALREFTRRGIPTYFLPGNRDFLIGRRFAKKTGITLIKDASIIDLYGEPTLLLHGDCLCTHDIKHQKSRRTMHNRLYQIAVVYLLPLWYRRRVANRIRANSKARYKTLTPTIMDVNPDTVMEYFDKYGVKRMIHGHTHRPNIHQHLIDQQEAERIVLGCWQADATILRVDNDGNRLLESL